MDNVTQVNADADVNLLGWFLVYVVSAELGVNLLGTLHGMDDGREVYEEGIPDRFDDGTMMLAHSLLDQPIMHVEQPQRAGLVAAHLAAKADDVGKHDRRQPPSLRVRRAVGVVLHRYRLFCWRYLAVNPLPRREIEMRDRDSAVRQR